MEGSAQIDKTSHVGIRTSAPRSKGEFNTVAMHSCQTFAYEELLKLTSDPRIPI